jgi:uncharacterized membrane protein YgcG
MRPFRTGLSPTLTALVALTTLPFAACGKKDALDATNNRELAALLEDGELPSQLALTVDPTGPGTMPGAPAPTTPVPSTTPPGMTSPPLPVDAAAVGEPDGGPRSDGGMATDGSTGPRDAAAPPDSRPPRDGAFDMGPGPCSFRPDGGFPPPGCRPSPLARWDLNDCNSQRTDLREQMNGFTAFRTVGAACVEGIEELGVALPHEQDMVYAPDQPAYTFGAGVTVAAWIKPDKLGGARTIFRKRDGLLSSSLALMTKGNSVLFVIDRVRALPAAVAAPLQAGRWTHVAATYDGSYLRLYVDGAEAASTYAVGIIADGEGPLLFGNDILHRRFEGSIDSIAFDTVALDATAIARLLCIRKPPLLTVSPQRSEPAAPGSTVPFQVSLASQSSAVCPSEGFFVSGFAEANNFQIQPNFTQVFLAGGETAKIDVQVTSDVEAEPGDVTLQFSAFSFERPISLRASATYVVAETSGCTVRPARELMIRNVSVVDDPVRTTFAQTGDPRQSVWTFKTLMEAIAPTPADAPRLVEQVFQSFTTPQTINTFRVEPRPGMQSIILGPWARTPAGELDLERAPLRLLAIVNRMDLRQLDDGNAGEGRFVFGMVDAFGFPLEATVILEYTLPATTEADVHAWADAWHALGALPFPSEEYNAALAAVTARFADRGAAPGRPNGSALLRLRTNEIALSGNGIWELREFAFDEAGFLRPAPVALTPDRPQFDRTPALAAFINANEQAILDERHDIPLTLDGKAFLAGAVFNDLSSWSAPGINNPEARHKFSLNTCNGCHSSQETNTGFLMINNRFPGQESFLSGFLTGTTTFDPVTGPRLLNDLRRRNVDLRLLVCPNDPLPPLPSPPDGGFGGSPGGFGGSAGSGGFGGSGGFSGSGGFVGSGGSPGGFGGSTAPPPPVPVPPKAPPRPAAVGGPSTLVPEPHRPSSLPSFQPTVRSGIRRTH